LRDALDERFTDLAGGPLRRAENLGNSLRTPNRLVNHARRSVREPFGCGADRARDTRDEVGADRATETREVASGGSGRAHCGCRTGGGRLTGPDALPDLRAEL